MKHYVILLATDDSTAEATARATATKPGSLEKLRAAFQHVRSNSEGPRGR